MFKKWHPCDDRDPIDLDLGKEIDPPYPLVYRWRHSICWWLDGSTPSKYLPKNQKMGLRSKNGVQNEKNRVYKKWNRVWMGSGVIQMGWYFGKMTPRGSGSFLNWIFGLPRPTHIKKSPKVCPSNPRQTLRQHRRDVQIVTASCLKGGSRDTIFQHSGL